MVNWYVHFDAAAVVVATVVVVATELTPLNSIKPLPNTYIQKITVWSVKISISGDK